MSLFDIEGLKSQVEKLHNQTLENGFWEDAVRSTKILSELKNKQKKIELYDKLKAELENLFEMTELLLQEEDIEMSKEVLKSSARLEDKLQTLELETLLNGKYDSNNAIVTIHPGAGGTESQDWAEMLYRMYAKWASANSFTLKELDFLEGDEAGIKSVTFAIEGDNAYGYLKGEKGVHRLVRISPFDAGRKKTYFICFC